MQPADEQLWSWVAEVSDPEIPVLSITDLGIVRAIDWQDGRCEVTITPTYSGCPAMQVIEANIKAVLQQHGVAAAVRTVLSPAWTTDWISDDGRSKLRDPDTGKLQPKRLWGVLFGPDSMIPTLHIGDLILVNKFHYGIRLPVINTKITQGTPVQRGDVMVFRYPPRPSLDYIKRVVAVPGDEVAYLNKRLSINGKPVSKEPLPDYFDKDAMRYSKQFQEVLGERRHRILNDDDRPAFIPGAEEFPFRQNCRYTVEGVTCTVPPGHYFVMGDNRDNSLDSRYWGFVPDANIVGRAFFVWMNFGDLKRIGSFQ